MTADGVYLDPVKAREYGQQLRERYAHAVPYPHIALDGFLPTELTERILANFPTQTHMQEHSLNYSGIQVNKRQIFPNDCNEFCRNIFAFFNAAPFLQFLEGLTGIEGLISDPYFHGGGFHETSRGGKLAIHADFRLHEQLHLARRMNVLIYLNKDWPESYGGALEIWDQSMKTRHDSILPVFNRCVIFNTDAKSFHGHPDPITCPEDRSRKSVALYYYTASQAVYGEVVSNSTMYVARPGEDTYTQRQAAILRLQNYAKDFLPPVLFRMLRRLKQNL